MTHELRPSPEVPLQGFITQDRAAELDHMQSKERSHSMRELIPIWRNNPTLYLDLLRTYATTAPTLPAFWGSLTNPGRMEQIFTPSSSLPEQTIVDLIKSDTFAISSAKEPLQPALRRAFKLYLGSPIGYLRDPSPKHSPDIEQIRTAFIRSYLPLAKASIRMMNEAQNGDKTVVQRMSDFLLWYEEECTFFDEAVHPEMVAFACEINSLSKDQAISFSAVRQALDIMRYFVRSREEKNEHSGILQRAHDRTAYQVKNSLPKIERRLKVTRPGVVMGRHENTEITNTIETLEKGVGADFANKGIAFGPKLAIRDITLSGTVIVMSMYVQARITSDELRAGEYKDGECFIIPIPGDDLMIVGWETSERRNTVLRAMNGLLRELLHKNGKTQENVAGLSYPQLATCLNFLFERSNPAEQTARIAALNQTITSSPQRLHSRGYSIVFSDDRLTSIGLTGMALRQAGQGFAAVMRFFDRDIPVTIDAQGRCIFPEGFDDPRSQANVELIVKSHIDEIMRTDVTREQTSGTPGNVRPASAESEGETVSPSGAHFRVMEPGKRSLQIYHGKDPTLYIDASPEPVQKQESGGADSPPNPKRRMGNGEVNTRVMEWLRVDLEILNTLFHVLQQCDGDMAKAMADNALMRESSISIREKLVTLYSRIAMKKSGREQTLEGKIPRATRYIRPLTREDLGKYVAWDSGVESIDHVAVNRRLACDLSYVPEHTSRNSPSEPIELAITMAPEAYRNILPKGQTTPPSGRVFSAQ